MNLTRCELEYLSLESLHRARNWSKADVSAGELDADGEHLRFVVKDFRGRPLWYRVLAGRHFLKREWKALRALEGIEGIPRALAMPDADAIVLERLDGKRLDHCAHGELPDTVLEQLVAMVNALHERGVTHGDLHSQNVLVTEDGRVGLIDWATAGVYGDHPSGLRRWAFEEMRALDVRSLAKIKVYLWRDHLTAQDIDLLKNGASRAYRAVKKLRRVREKWSGKKKKRSHLETILEGLENRAAEDSTEPEAKASAVRSSSGEDVRGAKSV